MSRRRASTLATPARRARVCAAAARPLQRLQRARRRGRRACELGVAARRRSARRSSASRPRSAAWSGSTVGRPRASRSCSSRTRPARTRCSARWRRRRGGPSTCWIVLNDHIADGRDISWIWDADFELLAAARAPRRPARARAPRRWRCGSSTRASTPAARGRPRPRAASLDRALAGDGRAARSTPCRPTPRCSSCATCCATAASPRGGLGMSRPAGRDLARRRVRLLRRRPRALAGALAAPRATEVLDLGCGHRPRGARPRRRGHACTALDRDPELLEVLAARAERAGRRVRTVDADARDVRPRAEFDAGLRADAVRPAASAAPPSAPRCSAGAAHLRPGGTFAAAITTLEGESTDDDYGPPPPDMREVDDWVYSSRRSPCASSSAAVRS